MAVRLSTAPAAPYDPGFRLREVKLEKLTLDLATQHMKMTPSPTERNLSEKRVNFLTGKMLSGTFLTPTWIIARLADGTLVRINGQHTSNAIARLGSAWKPNGQMVMIEVYDVDSPEAQALLFRQIDSRQSGRTPLDVTGAYVGLYPELRNVDRKTAKLAAEAWVWLHRHVFRLPNMAISGDDRYELIENPKVRGYIAWLDGILTVSAKDVRRVPVVGAICGTWLKVDEEATPFWQEVMRGALYEPDDPTWPNTLAKWLSDVFDNPEDHEDVEGSDELYQGVVYAWNMWRAKRPVTAIKCQVRNGRFLEIAD